MSVDERDLTGLSYNLMKTLLRNLITAIVFSLVTVIFFIPFLFSFLIPKGKFLSGFISQLWAKTILKTAGVKVRIIGFEKIGAKGPFVFIANHQSYFDVLAILAYLPVRVCFFAKKELIRWPFIGWGLKVSDHILVDSGDRRNIISCFHKAVSKLKNGESVFIFAEGTRSEDDGLLPFRPGGFLIAIKTASPVVPVAIYGAGKVFPKGGWYIRPGEIVLIAGKPIKTEGMSLKDRESLMRETRSAIENCLRDMEMLNSLGD